MDVPCGIDSHHGSNGFLQEVPGVAGPQVSFHQKAGDPSDDHPGECICLALSGLICVKNHFGTAVFNGNDAVDDDDGHFLVLDALVDLQTQPDVQRRVQGQGGAAAFFSRFWTSGESLGLAGIFTLFRVPPFFSSLF